MACLMACDGLMACPVAEKGKEKWPISLPFLPAFNTKDLSSLQIRST